MEGEPPVAEDINFGQLVQQINNIVQNLGQLVDKLTNGVIVDFLTVFSRGVNLANTNPTVVLTATEPLVVTGITVMASAGAAGTAEVTWTDDSATATYSLIFDGVVPADEPLVVPLPGGTLSLDVDDVITVTGAAAQSVNISYRRGEAP